MMRLGWIIAVAVLSLGPGLAAAQETSQFIAPPDAVVTRRDAPLLPSVEPAVSQSRNGLERLTQPGGKTQVAAGMTLAELEALAERCNPTLALAAARVQAARAQQLQAGLYPNPVVGYIGSEIGNEGRAGQQGGFVSQEVVTAGKLHLNRAVASQEIRQAEYTWAGQRFRVLTDVRRGFYEVLIAQRTVELAQQLVAISESAVKTSEELLKANEVTRADVLQARIEADSAKILLGKAQHRYAAAWRNLAAVIGDSSLQPTTLAGSLEDGIIQLTWDDALSRLLTESPELAAAEAGVARARAALRRECAGRIPNLDLQAGVQYDHATQDTFASVQVGVPIPIYNRNQGNISKAQAELAAAQEEVRRVRLALEQRLAAVFEQYASARQQVETYTRDIIPNAAESLKLVAAGYRQGEFSYLMLLTSQRTYIQTNLAYLDALRELRSAMTLLEGNLLSNSLENSQPSDGGMQ